MGGGQEPPPNLYLLCLPCLVEFIRHEYFRRILCDLVGRRVENGEYPNNEASLKKIIEGISSYNAMRYFCL